MPQDGTESPATRAWRLTKKVGFDAVMRGKLCDHRAELAGVWVLLEMCNPVQKDKDAQANPMLDTNRLTAKI